MSEWKKTDAVSALDEIIYVPTRYNYQLDNRSFVKLRNSAQCGYTSAAVFLSAWLPEYNDDSAIEKMIFEIDKNFIEGKSRKREGAFQSAYSKYFEKCLPAKKIITRPNGGFIDEIVLALAGGSPVFTSTMLTGYGHYVCIVGYNKTKKSWIVNDPYGRFDFGSKKYVERYFGAGKEVLYSVDDFDDALSRSAKIATGGNGYRYIYAC